MAGDDGDGLAVRPLTAGDRTGWGRLWAGYCAFYGVDLPDGVTGATWTRLLDAGCPVHGWLAEDGGTPVGLAHVVVHPNTWSTRPVGYLEDLFVAPAARGRGVGRRLLEALSHHGRAAGWLRLYWMTKPDNRRARALYESLTPVTDWLRYDRPLNPESVPPPRQQG